MIVCSFLWDQLFWFFGSASLAGAREARMASPIFGTSAGMAERAGASVHPRGLSSLEASFSFSMVYIYSL